jgi:hypothetical protein
MGAFDSIVASAEKAALKRRTPNAGASSNSR